jgi:hypothetical protein
MEKGMLLLVLPPMFPVSSATDHEFLEKRREGMEFGYKNKTKQCLQAVDRVAMNAYTSSLGF